MIVRFFSLLPHNSKTPHFRLISKKSARHLATHKSELKGVTKTKTLENEDLRPVFVFVVRKRRPRSSFSYYENEDPNIKYPKSIEITSLDVH